MLNRFQNIDLVRLALKRRRILIAVVLLSGICAYIFSSPYFIRPKFKSTGIVYPVNIIPYSLESPTEQLLQLFNSADVRTMMVQRFELDKHYGIDTNGAAGKTKLNLAFDENVIVRKTEFESIKIDIYDVNPDTACVMVNGLIESVNLKARRLHREKTREVVRIYREQLNQKQQQIDSLERIMGELRIRYGLLDYKAQSKEATKSYLKLVGDGASKDKLRQVDSLVRNLQEKGGSLVAVSLQLESTREAYSDIKIEYDKSISDMTKELTYSNVVTRPFASDTKAYPVRSLIVLIYMLSAFLLTLIVLIIIERKPTILPNAEADQK